MKKLSEQNKRYNQARIRRAYRKKYRNRALRKRRSQHGFETRSINYFKRHYQKNDSNKRVNNRNYIVVAGKTLCSSETEGLKNLLNLLKRAQLCLNKVHVENVFFDFSLVEAIDNSAICVILSLVEELSFNKKDVTGNLPENQNAHEIFRQSGFFAHVKKINGNRFETESEILNTLVKIGRSDTDQEYMGKEIKKAMKFLIGSECHFEPVFSILVELCGNSVEHAFIGKSHWFLSISYNEENKIVSFTFADNGQGIIKTLKRKHQKIIESLTLKNDGDILSRAFERKYGSRHEEQLNRNRGLPMVKKYGKYVNNFKVITNGVILRINQDYGLISPKYSGTFYQFEIDINCIKRWEDRLF